MEILWWRERGGVLVVVVAGVTPTREEGGRREREREREWWSQNFGSHGARLKTKKIEHKLIKNITNEINK
jgi:hypothetical protein